MGQRLVVTINHMGEDLCKLYYHWSAYSFSALKETQDIVNCIYNHEDETKEQLLLRLIRFCEANGGGIDGGEESDEFKYIQSLYPNEIFIKDGYSRSRGLIALSEKGMEQMQDWSEGDITIDLDEESIYNGVFCYYESLEEYNREMQECDDEFEPQTLDDITDIGYDLGDIAIENLDDILDELRNVDYVCRYGNEIYVLTE